MTADRKQRSCCEIRGETIYLDAETADVFFVVDNGRGGSERILGHKYIVAAVSDVFRAMFYGPLKKEEDIGISHVTPEILIAIHSSDVLKTEGFLECSKNTVGHILRTNGFCCSETEVFEACLAWILRKTNGGVVVKELIRFASRQ